MFTMEEVLSELSGGDINEQGLPPGFRFHPTDEELITFYLASKVFHGTFCGIDIAEVDLNRCEPWELPEAAKMGEREWYFFSLRDRKYPTGLRTNRATCAGYWKATGKDREVYSACNGALLGMKKTLVFYRGRAPKGIKTRWVMHEYRLDGDFSYRHSSREEWVICRIFHKLGDKKNTLLLQTQEEYGHGHGHENLESVSPGHSTPYSLPALFETPTPENTLMINHNQHQHLQSLLNIPISSSMPQSTLFHPSLPSPLGLPNPSTTPTSTASSISVHNINKTIKADVNHQQHSAPSATSSLFDSLVTNLHQQERHSCFTNWKLGGDDSQYQQQQLQQQLPVINSTIQKQCKIESDVNFPHNSVILQLPPHEPWLDKLLQTQHQSSQSSSHYPSSFKLDSNVTNTYGDVAAGFSFTAPPPTSPATAAALNTTTTTTAASVAAVHDLSTLISGFDCYGGLISNHAPLPIKLTGESWPLNP